MIKVLFEANDRETPRCDAEWNCKDEEPSHYVDIKAGPAYRSVVTAAKRITRAWDAGLMVKDEDRSKLYKALRDLAESEAAERKLLAELRRRDAEAEKENGG